MLGMSTEVNNDLDWNSNSDTITNKAMMIEDWINNLTLLNNRTIQRNEDQESEQEMTKYRRSLMEFEIVEKQILNINQIASSSELISV
jgi:hypothetical protein